jgi:hypothetical protein
LVILQKSPSVKTVIIIMLFFFINVSLSGQKDTLMQRKDSSASRLYLLQKVKRNGETLPEIEIKEVAVYGHQNSGTRREQSQFRKYERLVYNLKRVYPYALIVRQKLDEVNTTLMGIPDEKGRKEYLKKFEKDIFREYEDDIQELTITQGRLLIKLIDRETMNTSYALIKQYRGGLSAAFWQGIARIFGTNLKEEYDPWEQDILIELIIQDIENGLL